MSLMEWIDDSILLAQKAVYLASNTAQKRYHPTEPKSNIDQFELPPWFDREAFYASLETKYGEDATLLIGDRDKPVSARYFVVHDTSGAPEPNVENIDTNKDTKGIHLFLGTATTIFRPHIKSGIANDWDTVGWGTIVGNNRPDAFVHIELSPLAIADDGKYKTTAYKQLLRKEVAGQKRAGSMFTERQYQLLAACYLVASIRHGRLLTVTLHREVDRGISQNAHGDPRDFDIGYFYSVIAGLLGLGSVSFGIQLDRVMFHDQINITGHKNVFLPYVKQQVDSANQYGAIT